MVFSSIVFLFYFLPIFLIVYFVTPKKLKNSVLFLSGLIFFGQFAPEGMHPAVYSASYNGIYIFTEAILTIIIISIPAVSKALTNVKNLATQES